MKIKKPLIFNIFKGIGTILFISFIIFLILGIVTKVPEMGEDNWFEQSRNKHLFIFLAISSLAMGAATTLFGFTPEITRHNLQKKQYIMNENKDTLKNIANMNAEIMSESLKQNASSIKEGLEKNQKFCKYCGEEIDEDSKFCNHCGKKQ